MHIMHVFQVGTTNTISPVLLQLSHMMIFTPLSPLRFAVLKDDIFEAVHSSHISEGETENNLTAMIWVTIMSLRLDSWKQYLLKAQKPCYLALKLCRRDVNIILDISNNF